jgi:carboxyl-terminal processing protease
MKLFKHLALSLILSLPLSHGWVHAADPDPGQICISVGRLLEQGHYSRHKLDDDLSRRFLKNYLDQLDYNHLFFTQKDADAFEAKYATSLDDDILLGNPNPAFEIWDVYTKRVEDRTAKVKELLKQNFDFKSDRTVELNRQKSPWPKDDTEADQLWRDRIEGEFLQEKLNEHPIEAPLKVVTRRYNQLLRNIHEQTREDVIKTFLSVLAQTYDPHSEYLSKSDLESFNIQMRLSLVGIGAELRSEEGYAKIMDLIQGGPAQKDGRLKVGDRISAVAQGDKEFTDVIDMKLDKVVELIRGKKGSTVRLRVVPAHSTTTKIIDIVRDEVKLKDKAASAEIIEHPDAQNQQQRLGWIRLPSFYADMERAGAKGAASTTQDVLTLLNRLKQENISGLVIDLRNNGGGSLDEAVNLTGLFIKKGPVVQERDSNGNPHVNRTQKNSAQVYDGPLVVLTNRLSASASEIFAAALQDYGRAVIVGDDSTFGKGTVQTMLEIGRFIPFLGSSSSDAGALKLTIQKFYRIAGGSTQLRGVTSDIKLPSLYDMPDFGESALKNPMPYDVVDALPFDKVTDHPLFISELRQRSAARVVADPEFSYITEDLTYLKDKRTANKISLNEKARRAEIAMEKAKKEKRTAERAKRKKPDQKVYQITLDNADKPDLQLVKYDIKKKTDPEAESDPDAEDEEPASKNKPAIDPLRTESLNILNDLIELGIAPKTASAATKPAAASAEP